EEHSHHHETEEEHDEHEEAEEEEHEEHFAAESAHEEHHDEEHEAAHEEEHVELTAAERADLAHEEPLEHVESETLAAAAAADGSTIEATVEEDVVLLPGETRGPRDPGAPREDFARIGTNPRSRFQRPQRGGRDRGGFRGRDRGGDLGGRPDRRDR